MTQRACSLCQTRSIQHLFARAFFSFARLLTFDPMVQVTAGGSSASSIRDRGPVGSQCLTGVWMTVAQFPDSIPVVELEARRGAVTVSCPLRRRGNNHSGEGTTHCFTWTCCGNPCRLPVVESVAPSTGPECCACSSQHSGSKFPQVNPGRSKCIFHAPSSCCLSRECIALSPHATGPVACEIVVLVVPRLLPCLHLSLCCLLCLRLHGC